MSKRLVALFGTAVIVLAACGAQGTAAPPTATAPSATGTPTATATAAPPQLIESAYKPEAVGHTGGTLIMAEWQDLDTLNPYYQAAETDVEATMPMFLGLINISGNLKFETFPNMALADNVPLTTNGGVTVTGTKMDVTWQLHPGIKWSDGTDITCADLEATWKWNMDPDNSGLYGGTIGWEDIESVEDAGGGKCIIHYKDIYEGYLGQWAGPSFPGVVFPKKYIESIPVKDAPTKLYPLNDPAKGVYSGPYIPTKYTGAGGQLEYKPNAVYWQMTGKTQPFDKLIFKYYADAEPLKAGFAQGEYDIGFDLNHSDLPSLADKTKCDKVSNNPAGCNMIVEDTFTYEQHTINNARLATKFGQDAVAPIKQALALATDKQQITSRPLGGTVDPMGPNNVSPLFWYYKDEGPYTPVTSAQIDKANSVLDQAGWAKGSDGFRAKNGVKLELEYCTTTRGYRIDSLGLVASQLAAVGIKVDAKPYPANPNVFGGWNSVPNDQDCNLQHGNFDVAQFAWVSPFDPLSSYSVYHSSGIPENNPQHNGQNTSRTNDPAADAIWDQIKSTVDLSKVRDAMYAWQDFYSSHTIEIPLFLWKNVYIFNPKVHNLQTNASTAEILWNIDDWWSE